MRKRHLSVVFDCLYSIKGGIKLQMLINFSYKRNREPQARSEEGE